MEVIGKIRFCERDEINRDGRFGSLFKGKFEDRIDVVIERLRKKKFNVDADAVWASQSQGHANILRVYSIEENHRYRWAFLSIYCNLEILDLYLFIFFLLQICSH